MCKKADCDTCNKPTWKGCGKHIEEALKDVPEDERCKCPRDPPVSTTTTEVKKVEQTTNDETKDDVEVKPEENKVEQTINDETKHDAEVKTEENKVEPTVQTEEIKEKAD